MPRKPPASAESVDTDPKAPSLAPNRIHFAGPSFVMAAVVLAYSAGVGSRALLQSFQQSQPPNPSTAGGSPSSSGHDDAWAWTTNPTMGSDGFNWTQLSMSRAGNFPNGGIKYFDVDAIRERGAMWVWHTTFARSIPAVVSNIAQEYASKFEGWTREDYRRAWGDLDIVASFSPDALFQRGRLHRNAEGRRHQTLHRQRMRFGEFLDVLHAAETSTPVVEHVSVSQSATRDLSAFGLPDLPPLLADLVSTTLDVSADVCGSRCGPRVVLEEGAHSVPSAHSTRRLRSIATGSASALVHSAYTLPSRLHTRALTCVGALRLSRPAFTSLAGAQSLGVHCAQDVGAALRLARLCAPPDLGHQALHRRRPGAPAHRLSVRDEDGGARPRRSRRLPSSPG